MQCPQCHAENPEQARFCEDCGTRLDFKCPHCGEATTPGKKFCASCGGSLVNAPVPSRPAQSPQDYTPQHLAERIISSRSALEGERKQVTVLFADLKGSMELLADRDPEEARAILDPVLERMMEAVHRYEGTVNQVLGDGIMALFGAPLAHEDHAVRACYAALRMQDSVKQYAEAVRWKLGLPLQIRVGLNSGEVVVRSIGSDLRMDYTAVGQTTHVAARMEQVATPGSVLLAPDTLRLTEGYVQVKALGQMEIKGLAEPVEVHELLGAGTARSRLQAAAARGLTRFVGRDAELDTLRRALDQATGGHGQVVALVGEAGVGKSRLVWEFSHSHYTRGWLVLESHSVSYGKATPYLPVLDLLRAYCGIEARDDARRRREKVVGKLLSLDRALEPTLPAFLALLDVPTEDATWEGLDPPQRRQRTLDALKLQLLRESRVQPLLLVFEDLHWIDSETQALLDSLVDSLPTARLLLLVNYRPEYAHGWTSKTYYAQLRLDSLQHESAEEFLQALMGNDASLQRLTRLLIQRTEGNPFFIEESVRTLIENGVLAGERGAYRLTQSPGTAQIPTTVQAVLAARIDRLAPEDKRLLQTAAVIGKDVRFGLLQAVAEFPEAALREGLARLQAAEFIYETSLFPDLEYTFKHALTHEVAYSSLLQERRRALHARIVEALEARYADRLAEQVERLAHHAVRGEMWEKAVPYLRQAAAKAASNSAHRESVDYIEQALDVIRHLTDSRPTKELAIDVRLDLRNSLLSLGELDRLLDHLRVALALAESLADERRLGWVRAHILVGLFRTGDYQGVVALGKRVLAAGSALAEPGMRAHAQVRVGMALYSLGDYREALTWAHSSLATLKGPMARETFGMTGPPAIMCMNCLTVAAADLGEFAEAEAVGQAAIGLAEETGHPFTRITSARHMAYLYQCKGDLQKTIRLLEDSLRLAERLNIAVQTSELAVELGHAYTLNGRIGEGILLLEQGEHQILALGLANQQSRGASYLAEAYLLGGRRADSVNQAERALALAREYHERGNEAKALWVLGDIAACADPPGVEQATDYYGRALALAEELGMRPLVAHCHLEFGTLYRKVGRHDEADADLNTAAEMFRAMEMTFWLAKAETELAQVAH
jgi:class 3 adenylate cyclase/tetratricopeptide (TPR) repeat protein